LSSPAVPVAVGVLIALAGCSGSERPAAVPQHHERHGSARTAVANPVRSAGESIVATARRRQIAVYRSAGSTAPFLRLANPTASGAPLIFLVRKRLGGRDQVYLPVRPNESTGWVDDRDVVLASNPYSLQ